MKYQVYYAKTLPRDLGDDFAFVPGETHVFIREIEADALDEAYAQMQGWHWSPHGEARSLIRAAGVSHTSMSVGDVLLNRWGRAWACARMGWQTVYPPTLADWVHRTLDAVKAFVQGGS